MPNEMLPMSTWTPKDGQTYEIVDAEARERITDLEEHAGDVDIEFMTAAEVDALWGSIDGLPDGDEVSY